MKDFYWRELITTWPCLYHSLIFNAENNVSLILINWVWRLNFLRECTFNPNLFVLITGEGWAGEWEADRGGRCDCVSARLDSQVQEWEWDGGGEREPALRGSGQAQALRTHWERRSHGGVSLVATHSAFISIRILLNSALSISFVFVKDFCYFYSPTVFSLFVLIFTITNFYVRKDVIVVLKVWEKL